MLNKGSKFIKKKGIFKVINNILDNIYIFNSRFINKVKNKGINKAFTKLRLMV